jgi:hypothetical protein
LRVSAECATNSVGVLYTQFVQEMADARGAVARGLVGSEAVDNRLDIGTNPSVPTAEPLQLALESLRVADDPG